MSLLENNCYLKKILKDTIANVYFNINGTLINKFTFLDTLEENDIKEVLLELSEEYNKNLINKLVEILLSNLKRGYIYTYNKTLLMYGVDYYYIIDADNNIEKYLTDSSIVEALKTDYKDAEWELVLDE